MMTSIGPSDERRRIGWPVLGNFLSKLKPASDSQQHRLVETPQAAMHRSDSDDWLAVDAAPAGLLAISSQGSRIPIMRDGAPLTDYGLGWRPEFVYGGLGSILLLELRHSDGRQGTWYLDSDFTVFAHGFDGLALDQKRSLQVAAMRKLDQTRRVILASSVENLDVSTSILQVGKETLDQILHDIAYSTPASTRYLSLDQRFSESARFTLANNGRRVPVSIGHLRSMMGAKIVDLVPEAVATGALSFPSPVDGTPIAADASICVNTFVFFYRCVDRRYDLPFLVIASTHVCKIISVYFPNSDECFTINRIEEAALRGQLPHGSVEKALLHHIVHYGRPLVRYLDKQDKTFTCLAWHRHLGHHLWQDLTGLMAIEKKLTPARMPPYLMVSPNRSEMFGPIDRLFPGLAGRVDRSCDDVVPFIHAVYNGGLFLLSPADSYISRELASRIIDYAESVPEVEADRLLLDASRTQHIPVILLGLRVENRTVVDFPEFCEKLVDMLLQETGGSLVLVIDGHNSGEAGVFDSVADNRAKAAPIQVEMQIVARLRARYANQQLTLVDTIGATMQRSVFWSHHADFFITPWGAGLAKYSWIANKPGLVLAGELYQRKGFDLHIYDSSEFVEAPQPMTILSIEDVRDVPEDQCLIPVSEPQRTNFRVEMSGVQREVRALLRAMERL